MKARVLLADDHALVRRGVKLILDGTADLEVVGEVGSGDEAVAFCRTNPVDLAVLDVAMPRMTGLAAAREITRRPGSGGGPAVLMLSMHDHEQYFFEALRAGAAGYVLKSAADQDLVEACRAALRGESFVYAGAMTALVRSHLERAAREGGPANPLTAREDEVLKLIAEGHSSQEIADALVISLRTVERHRANILAKLGMRDRTQLTRYAIRAGLVEP